MDSRFLISVSLDKEGIALEDYPYCLPACRGLDALEFNPGVTFFVGENGSGKSTLLEAIAVAWGFNPEGGTVNFKFSTCLSHSPLHERLTLVKGFRRPKNGFFLRAESFYNVASEIERMDSIPAPAPPIINSYGGHSLHAQSHGESFLTLAMKRFGPEGLYILDEPEAALSPSRQLALLARMRELAEAGSQFVIATHSPILMAYPGATIYRLSEEGVSKVAYEDTEHYAVTKEFVNNRERILKELFGES